MPISGKLRAVCQRLGFLKTPEVVTGEPIPPSPCDLCGCPAYLQPEDAFCDRCGAAFKAFGPQVEVPCWSDPYYGGMSTMSTPSLMYLSGHRSLGVEAQIADMQRQLPSRSGLHAGLIGAMGLSGVFGLPRR